MNSPTVLIWLTIIAEFFTLHLRISSALYVNEERPKDFRLIIPEDYDGNTPPRKNGAPVVVDIKISPIKMSTMTLNPVTIRITTRFAVHWNDYRVIMKHSSNTTGLPMINLQPEESEKLWKPVLGIRNAMDENILTPTNIKCFEWQLFFDISKTSAYHCDFDFTAFPMDTQKCFMEIQAFNYKSSVVLRSPPRASNFERKSDPSELVIGYIHTGNCSTKDKLSQYYSCVKYGFTLQRRFRSYLLLTFLPSGLIVVFSWASFWLDDVGVSTPRATLGVTTMLALMNQLIYVQKNVPKVGYLKAVDVWMLTCMFMISANLVEFAIVHEHNKIRAEPVRHRLPNQMLEYYRPRLAWKALTEPSSSPIDQFSRRLFPMVFLVFNFIYWSYYGTRYRSL